MQTGLLIGTFVFGNWTGASEGNPQIIRSKVDRQRKWWMTLSSNHLTRNRLILELMPSGMRIGEVLKLTPSDIEDRKANLRGPQSG